MSYSSLNTARSAVSNLDFDIGQNPNHVSIGKHFLVSKYLKGVFHEIKPVPKYRSIWSVDPVLDYLFFFMAVRQVAAQGAFAQISVTGCFNDWTAVSDVDIFGHLGGVYG